MHLGSQRILKMDDVVKAPFPGLAAQPREAAIFEGEPGALPKVPFRLNTDVSPSTTTHSIRRQGGRRFCHGVSLPTLTALTERIPMIPAGRPSRAGRLALKESVVLCS